MTVLYSKDVELDLEEIADYIASDNPRRAVSFIREVRAELTRIGQGPLHYQLRPELGKDTRSASFGRYVILFRFTDDVVYIERVVQGNRLLPPLYHQ